VRFLPLPTVIHLLYVYVCITGMANGRQPCAEALYDFEAESDGEISFLEGDVIQLVSQVDENWYEGTAHGHTGYFPINYVKVLVALPSP